MTHTVEAVYEKGILKLAAPLPLPENARVQVTVQTQTSPLLQAHGIMGWTGSAALADYFASDGELDPQED